MLTPDLSATATKIANAEHPIHPLLQQRWSPRAFAAQPVTTAELLSLLEAARWAPSSGNGQPWHFIVGALGTTTHARLAETLNEGNLPWAAAAPVLMLTVAKLTTSSGRPATYAFYDVGLAVAQLTIQAVAQNLYVHQMGGFQSEKARALFAIPEEFAPVTMLAIGYLGAPAILDARNRERELAPRTRRSLHEFVFETTWGQPTVFVK